MNYKQVIEDLNNGIINPNHYELIVDNDSGYWLCTNPNISEEEQDNLADEMIKKYGKPGGYNDIIDVLNVVGINADMC